VTHSLGKRLASTLEPPINVISWFHKILFFSNAQPAALHRGGAAGVEDEGRAQRGGAVQVGIDFHPYLESAWFQPLNLECGKPGFKIWVFKCNVYRYSVEDTVAEIVCQRLEKKTKWDRT
jgi:hypothetical protein